MSLGKDLHGGTKAGGVAMETEGETGLSESEIARGRRTNPGDRRDQFTERAF